MSTELPAVARRRVRLAIRAARAAKGLTQTDVANAMEWSLSKVMRIEKGEVNISSSDLKLLLSHLGIDDPAQVQQLMADARLFRQERWKVDPQDREQLTSAMVELAQYESEATSIRYFNTLLVPAILQTRAYSTAIFDQFLDMDPSIIAARVEYRQRRQQEVLYQPSSANHLVILDESVLWRPIGGAEVLAGQLDQLVRLASEATLQVRIMPFLTGATALAFYGSFVLYGLDEDDQGALLYREWPGQDEIVRAAAEIDRHRVWFEKMWALALDEPASTKLITERARAIRSG